MKRSRVAIPVVLLALALASFGGKFWGAAASQAGLNGPAPGASAGNNNN
jgi:hypothetical protein